MCEAVLSGCSSSRRDVRERLACVTRPMDVHARSVLAGHFSVRSSGISDVVIIGDLHAQRHQLVVNTDQVCST